MLLSKYLIPLGLVALLVAACATQSPTASPLPPTTAATATPSAPTVTPDSPTATPEDPFADLGKIALAFDEQLYLEIGPRPSATEEELHAAQFLANKFGEMGYTTQIQPFNFERLSRESSSLTITDGSQEPGQEPIEVAPMSGSAAGLAEGLLVDVGLGKAEELPEESLEGKIALIQRGDITFQDKASLVAQKGAVAAVIYNALPGSFRGALGEASAIPVVGISQEDGVALVETMAQGPVEAALLVDRATLQSRNVIAEMPGGQGPVVVLGGHYDTVAVTAGANDNSSGTAVLLTLAGQLAGRELPFRVRFIAFGSEELGLLGSQAYVDPLAGEPREEIAAMLNFDALASGNSVMVLGSDSLTELAAQVADDLDISIIRRRDLPGGDSDHTSFARQGIPVLMFTAPDFSRIHTPNDTLEFINPKLLTDSARLALGVLNSEGFPGLTPAGAGDS